MKINKKALPAGRRGFTPIEIVISVVILLFVLGAFLVIYFRFTKFYNIQQAELRMADSARQAVKELQLTALQANHIVASHDFSGTVYATDEDVLVLEIPSIDSSGDIVSGKYDYAVFYTSGENFYKLAEADAASSRSSGRNQISDSVNAITFTYDNADLSQATKIDTDIELENVAGARTISVDLHQAVYLRNI